MFFGSSSGIGRGPALEAEAILGGDWAAWGGGLKFTGLGFADQGMFFVFFAFSGGLFFNICPYPKAFYLSLFLAFLSLGSQFFPGLLQKTIENPTGPI